MSDREIMSTSTGGDWEVVNTEESMIKKKISDEDIRKIMLEKEFQPTLRKKGETDDSIRMSELDASSSRRQGSDEYEPQEESKQLSLSDIHPNMESPKRQVCNVDQEECEGGKLEGTPPLNSERKLLGGNDYEEDIEISRHSQKESLKDSQILPIEEEKRNQRIYESIRNFNPIFSYDVPSSVEKLSNKKIQSQYKFSSDQLRIPSQPEKVEECCVKKYGEGGQEIYYQTMKLYDEGKDYDLSSTSGLKLIGVGPKLSNFQISGIDQLRVSRDQKFDQIKKYSEIWQDSYLYKQQTQNPKGIKLAICITMYEESYGLLEYTLNGIMDNIKSLYESQRNIEGALSPEQFSNQFMIVLVADGYQNLKKEEFKNQAEQKGLFVEEAMKPFVKNIIHKNADYEKIKDINEIQTEFGMKLESDLRKDYKKEPIRNIIHTFQSKVRLDQFSDQRINEEDGEINRIKLNFTFAVKQLNKGKIDSHLYFYRGFCQYLQPELCLLLDIGTQPQPGSIVKLMKFMDIYKNLGGVCGEIAVDQSSVNGLVWAQNLEYKLGHFLDKSFEGSFGYQTVLPGAFSMFRWNAIKQQPLEEFFKGRNKENLGLKKLNMYLAEDRIMCFEIVRQPSQDNLQKNLRLLYVPQAVAKTDPQTELSKLMGQRKRWFNGSIACQFHIFSQISKFSKSNQTFCSKLKLQFYFILCMFIQVLAILTPGLFYSSAVSFIIHELTFITSEYNNLVTTILGFILLFFCGLLVILSLGMGKDVKDTQFQKVVHIINAFLSIVNFSMICVTVFRIRRTEALFTDVVEQKQWNNTAISIICAMTFITVFILPPLLFEPRLVVGSKIGSYIKSVFWYLYYMPLFNIIIPIYALSNIHNVSWASRVESLDRNIQNSDMPIIRQQQKKVHNSKVDLKRIRLYVISFWIISNMGASLSIINLRKMQYENFLFGIGMISIGYQLLKIVMMVFYRIKIGLMNSKIRHKHIQYITQVNEV